jgi:hypothetical protein
MKERPILFSAPMVRAILDGTKTQTRRVVKLPIIDKSFGCEIAGCEINGELESGHLISPYGEVGDQLWVRETFAEVGTCDPQWILYRASDYMQQVRKYGFDNYLAEKEVKWKPSIFMPRYASRIQLEITNIRVERLTVISEDDSYAEGIERLYPDSPEHNHASIMIGNGHYNFNKAAGCYKFLWEHINGAGSWAKNPWVWVIEFKRV